MFFCIFQLFLTRFYIPDSPRSDYFHIRCKMLYCKFKSHLIISLSGTAPQESATKDFLARVLR